MTNAVHRKLMNQETLCWLALATLLAGFFAWGLNHLEGFAWAWDEGVFLLTGRMVQLGYPLYREVWYNYPPAFFVFLVAAFELVGNSVEAGRTVVLLFATLGLLGVAMVLRELAGWLGAFAAVTLLILNPHFFTLSRAAVADVPLISLATISMALVLRYIRLGSSGWLIASGLALSIGILMKPLAAFIALPLALAVLLHPRGPRSRKDIARDLGCLFLSMGVPVLLCLAAYDWRAFLTQVFGTYLQSKAIYPLDLAQNARQIWAYLVNAEYELYDYGFPALAACGCLALLRRPGERGAMVMLIWLSLTLGILWTHSPLYSHHLILLLFPVAILGGVAIDRLWHELRFRPSRSALRQGSLFLGLLALGLSLLALPRIVALDGKLLAALEDDEDRDAREVVRLLEASTGPEDFIVTDSPMIAFRAGRRVPPLLCNTSSMRIKTGGLTAEKLIAATERYAPRAVIFWDDRLEMLPAYVDWVRGRYKLTRWYGKERRIYTPLEPIEYVQRANLGDKVLFLGYNINRLSLKPRDTIHLTLYWQTQARMTTSYTVFVHLLDGEKRRWGQADSVPAGGTLPTTCWHPGDIIADKYEIVVDPEAPPGEYLLGIGIYDRKTGERLPVFEPSGERVPEDQVLLVTRLLALK